MSVPQSHYLAATVATASSSRARRCPRGPVPAKEVANSDTLLTFPEDDEHDKAAAEDEAKACVQDKPRTRPWISSSRRSWWLR